MGINTRSDKNIAQSDIHQKLAFKKYLPVSELDKKWGFTINDLGHSVIPENSEYPSKGHPGTHMFSWETGRILNEYHFVLITEGNGVFESKSAGTRNISAGDGFMLFPGEWHRYKPLQNTGWTEKWVGFSGQIAEMVMGEFFFKKEQAIIQKCANMLVQNFLKTLFQLVSEEPFGFQRTASGICLQLIAEICNIQKGSESVQHASSLISKAKYLMHKKINENVDFQTFCNNHGISYSKFRIDFKNQTGYAPLQYFLLMKIEKAKELLNDSEMRAKQIAYELGFKSDHYFSRVFKMKTGMTPQVFRMQRRNKLQ